MAGGKHHCPNCGAMELRHIPEYGRYYCDACHQYAAKDFQPSVAPAAAPAAAMDNPCPSCGKELRWIAQYNRWYCDAEKKYA